MSAFDRLERIKKTQPQTYQQMANYLLHEFGFVSDEYNGLTDSRPPLSELVDHIFVRVRQEINSRNLPEDEKRERLFEDQAEQELWEHLKRDLESKTQILPQTEAEAITLVERMIIPLDSLNRFFSRNLNLLDGVGMAAAEEASAIQDTMQNFLSARGRSTLRSLGSGLPSLPPPTTNGGTFGQDR